MKLVVVGLGQCGGRIADEFARLNARARSIRRLDIITGAYAINTDLAENKHFIKDYQLYTKSLIIAEFKDGKQVRWKNLAKVWNYLNDRNKFYEYVQSEIKNYLEGI